MARLSGVTSRQAIRVVSVIGFLVAPALVAAALVGHTAAATTFTYGYGPTPMVSSIEPMLIRELPAASRARVSGRNLDEEIASLNGRRCIGAAGRPLERCDHRPGEGAVTVAVVGDSKMHQWLPALEALAGVQSIELVSLLVSGCPFVVRAHPSRRALRPGLRVVQHRTASNPRPPRRRCDPRLPASLRSVRTSGIGSIAGGDDGGRTRAPMACVVGFWPSSRRDARQSGSAR